MPRGSTLSGRGGGSKPFRFDHRRNRPRRPATRSGYRVCATIQLDLPAAGRSRCCVARRAADHRSAADLFRPPGRHDRLSSRWTVPLGCGNSGSGGQTSRSYSMTDAQTERPVWLSSLTDALSEQSRLDQVVALRPGIGARPAAVLILIGEGATGPEIMFIERAAGMRTHAGQIAFPGGAADADDLDPADTAR